MWKCKKLKTKEKQITQRNKPEIMKFLIKNLQAKLNNSNLNQEMIQLICRQFVRIQKKPIKQHKIRAKVEVKINEGTNLVDLRIQKTPKKLL